MAAKEGIVNIDVTLGYKVGSATDFTILNSTRATPDLGVAPSQVDITRLKDHNRRYAKGRKDFGSLEFTLIHDKTEFSALKALESSSDTITWQLTYPDDSEASNCTTRTFTAELSIDINGTDASGDDAITDTLTLFITSEMT